MMILTRSSIATSAVVIGLAGVALGTVAASSSAATVQKIGGGSFSGISATGANHTISLGAMVLTCTGASFSAISGTGTPGAGSSFSPSYSGCTVDITGIVCSVSISTPGRWTLSATGSGPTWVGATTIASAATITIDDPGCGFDACVITFPAGGPFTGGQLANEATAPAGVRIRGSISGIPWTATPTCGIGASGSNATYAIPGTGIKVPGIQIVP